MKPRWTYDLECVRGRTRRGFMDLFYVLRNENKKFGPFKHQEQAERVIQRFRAWAVQPWRG